MTDQVNDATQEQNNDAQNNLASVPTVSYSGAVTRELKKGDLVRVAERRGPGVKTRDGGLGRIHQSIPADNGEVLFDVDFVLGGRMTNVPRQDLIYTTADAEGMTERQKRDRNPSTLVKEAEETKGVKQPRAKKKRAGGAKKKGGGAKGKAAAKRGKSPAGGKQKGKNAKARGKKTTAMKAKAEPKEKKEEDETDVVVKNLYEKHTRDFEKCLARLEKQDKYAFFLGDPPPEYDEHYGGGETDGSSNVQEQSAQSDILLAPTMPPVPTVFPETPPFNFAVIRKRMAHGRYELDRVRQHKERTHSRTAPALIHPKGIDWDQFRDDVVQMCDAAIARDPEGVNGGRGTLGHTAVLTKNHVLKLYDVNGRRQMKEMEDDEARHKFYNVLRSKANNEAAMQGKWRRTAFPERIYERLSSNVVCAGLSSLDERTAVYELQTNLPDSFVGLSYTYTDTGQSEGWMKSVLDDTKGNDSAAAERKAALDLANDDGVVRAQVQATMTSLLIGVQDRVMTDAGVLKDDELRSANWAGDVDDLLEETTNDSVDTTSADSPDIVEQPVWGIDCYTRRNITSCIEADFDSAVALEFIEKWLLPAINACPVSLAHNMINAARILEGLSLPTSTALEEEHADDSGDERWSHSLLGKALKDKMNKVGPTWLKSVAHQLRLAISTLGHDFFRVHPKGHGAIVLRPKLKANSLVTFYRGEVYPSWRWGEKMDAIELTQNRLNLRPNLPDFYNMALERPQVDPRGYGLLFVDASRKAGHGSSLSHSCEPTCEVRVAAVDGQLCLAMTTIRELELGEELTFDYNAVTESLNEYRSAVCLCGHGRCRGSFLHFATADCYQEVLNRNAPIAVRVSNLIKGCAKQVMSEADEDLLASHGFGTAAFGAASFRNVLLGSDSHREELDSMENVPIWLRTYVADTLRYIEYERRALPVMLLCNHLKRAEAKLEDASSKKARKNVCDNSKAKDDKPAKKQKKTPTDESKPIKGSKPEPVFLFFSRKRSDFFRSQLASHGLGHLKGREQQGAMLKIASSCWKALSDDLKQQWKEKAILDWKENGGEEKARLEAERLKAEQANSKKRKSKDATADGGSSKKRRKSKSDSDKNAEAVVYSSHISFEAADAEGVSAMEQRIQQLTQTLSRVGRVLNRHRESSLYASSSQVPLLESKAEAIHSPLATLSDDDVVYWLWRHENGPVRTLLRSCSPEKCVSPSLLNTLKATEKRYSALLDVEASSQSGGGLFPPNAREKVTEALLELRENLCSGLLLLEGEMRQYELERSRFKAKARREAAKKKKEAENASSLDVSQLSTVRETVSSVLDSMVNIIVERSETPRLANDNAFFSSAPMDSAAKDFVEDDLPRSPWLQHFSDRWKLEAVADLLLFYAHTKTFFAIKPYAPLESTPIEVYARELGNEVPQSVIETAHEKANRASNDVVLVATKTKNGENRPEGDSLREVNVSETQAAAEEGRGDGADSNPKQPSRAKSRALCKPDDIITNVTITYQGDYVLSQLLQWYNGGIGQKPGLPDLEGCVVLPSMSGPWRGTLGGAKSGKIKPTRYASEVRSVLLDWLNDPHKRGSPFDGQLSQVFPRSEREAQWDDAKFSCSPVGSPVLDLLVTGEDTSLRNIATSLFQTIRSTEKRNGLVSDDKSGSTTDRLQNTVDEGMPAQAVSHWVQCENPDCLKWRKLPWYVDVDALPEKFFCSDNKWDAAASSCDAPEDTWDENDSQLHNNGIAKESDAGMVAQAGDGDNPPSTSGGIDVKQFIIGARFDVLRSGKDFYSTGEVVNVDFSGPTKRVMFHFPKTKAIYDEWIEIGSTRIAPLNSKQDLDKGPGSKKKSSGKKMAKETKEKKPKVPPTPTLLEKKLVVNATENGSDRGSGATIASLEAQVLQGLMGSASISRGMESSVANLQNTSFLHAASQQAYDAYSSQFTGRLPQPAQMSPLVVSGKQSSSPRATERATKSMSSPVVSSFDSRTSPGRSAEMRVPRKGAAPVMSSSSASYSIPSKSPERSDTRPTATAMSSPSASFAISRKSAGMNGPTNGRAVSDASASGNSFTIPRKSAYQGGDNGSETLISRIPNPTFNDASRFIDMTTASALTRTALNGNYLASNLQHQMYQQQQAQMMQQASQYFGARTYWQGQHLQQLQPRQQQPRQQQQQQQQQQAPRQYHQQEDPRYGGSPSRRQYEGERR